MPTRPASVAPGSDPRITPWRTLAAAVVERALADARGRVRAYERGLGARRSAQADALEFLTSPRRAADLSFWIAVLGCDARQVRALIQRALDGRGNGNGRRPKRAKTP
jgi:hypothetical protein